MLTTFFADIKDFRRPQGQKYDLSHLFAFATLAVLCNAKSYRDIHRFVKTHFNALIADFNLGWKAAPAYTTIRNAIIGVNPEELEAAFRAFTQSMLHYWPVHERVASDKDISGITLATCTAPLLPHIAIAMDGKTLRGSYDSFKAQPALHQLFFYDQERKLILGHMNTEGKGCEMIAAQALLEQVVLPGAVFTLDALHCQKKRLSRLLHLVMG